MYFVATNHIEFFDPAITRSQRFDAVLFVSPPSFDSKRRQLQKILKERYGLTANLSFRREDIDSALASFKCVGAEQPLEGVLAKFALLRFDELGELALNLKATASRGLPITSAVLADALRQIQDGRWRGPHDYSGYLQGPSFERLELTKVHTWRVIGPAPELKSPYLKTRNGKDLKTSNGKALLVGAVRSLDDLVIADHKVISKTHGRVRILPNPSEGRKNRRSKRKR